MKKIFFIATAVIVLIAVMLCVIFHFVKEWNYLIHDVGAYEVDNFKSHKKDFEIIAESVISFYDEEKGKNDKLAYITVDKKANMWKIMCSFEKTNNYREVTDEEAQAYDRIQNAFPKTEYGGLSLIKVFEDRVVFVTGTSYALVHMRNEKRPEYILDKDEKYESIYVERLSKKWYQVKGKP